MPAELVHGRPTLSRTSSPGPLSQEGFEQLLALLDPDRDQAGQKYETLRRKLVRFFEWRNCHPAEELADETLDRVARKLAAGVEVRLPDPGPYVYGVARNVAREALVKATHAPSALLGAHAEAIPDPAGSEPRSEELDQSLSCLDRCLEAMPIEAQQLLLLYHAGEGPRGRQVAQLLGISTGALWVRMHRLRKRLERCVRECVESSAAPVKGQPSRPHSPVTKERP